MRGPLSHPATVTFMAWPPTSNELGPVCLFSPILCAIGGSCDWFCRPLAGKHRRGITDMAHDRETILRTQVLSISVVMSERRFERTLTLDPNLVPRQFRPSGHRLRSQRYQGDAGKPRHLTEQILGNSPAGPHQFGTNPLALVPDPWGLPPPRPPA